MKNSDDNILSIETHGDDTLQQRMQEGKSFHLPHRTARDANCFGLPRGVIYSSAPKNGEEGFYSRPARTWLTPEGKVVAGQPWDDGVVPEDDVLLPTIEG